MLKHMIEGIITKITETHYVTMEGNIRHIYHKKWYRVHQETESTGKVRYQNQSASPSSNVDHTKMTELMNGKMDEKLG
ncbi:hypothetical protein [Ammoniphilus sp. 3BR4]|uniref:hypothetical protein n=1 Tax=Ammoniphilus sp. 3BR4 TaxID=3158265 RepID=UPI0034661746